MTVTSTVPFIQYPYNGLGDYSFPFKILDDDDLAVFYETDAGVRIPLAKGIDFNITTIQGVDGGTVSLIAENYTGGVSLEIRRATPVSQETNWVNNEVLDMDLLEAAFDRTVMMLQDMYVEVNAGAGAINWRGTWITGIQYGPKEIVAAANGNYYFCNSYHTSGNFDTDLAAGLWYLMLDMAPFKAEADRACDCADDAAASEAAAAISETNAGISAASAAADAGAIAGQVATAVDAAAAASTSADNAAGSANNALTFANAAEASSIAAGISEDAAAQSAFDAAQTAAMLEDGWRTKHGFEIPVQVTLSYSSATRQLTLTPPATFDIWIHGDKYTKTGAQVAPAHAATAGFHYVVYNSSGELAVSTTPFDILGPDTPVAIIFWSAALSQGIVFYECHTSERNLMWHKSQHSAFGTYIKSGFAISGYTLNTDTNAAVSFAIDSGTIVDEDIEFAIPALADAGPYMLMRRIGANDWTWTTTNAVPYFYGATYIQYNQNNAGSFQLTELATGDYVNYWVVFMPNIDTGKQIVIIPGQTKFTNLADAQAESPLITNLGVFANAELVLAYKLTFGTNASYTSSGKVRLFDVIKYNLAKAQVTGALAGGAHNAHSGRSDAGCHPATAITTATFDDIAAINAQASIQEVYTKTKLLSRDNLLHNGQFSFTTRGNSTNVSGQYCCDRWKLGYYGGLCTATIVAFGAGNGDYIEGNPPNVVAFTTTGQSANNHSAFLEQHIEDVKVLSGKTITISFWAWSAAGDAKISANAVQMFGTGGSSTVYCWSNRSVAINTGVYQKHVFTISLPSVAGKTITADNRTVIALYMSGGSDYAFATGGIGLQNNLKYITNIKVEIGTTPTIFVRPNITTELAIIKRYYEVISGTAQLGVPYVWWRWTVEKRIEAVVHTLLSGGFGGGVIDAYGARGFRLGTTPTVSQDFVVAGDTDL